MGAKRKRTNLNTGGGRQMGPKYGKTQENGSVGRYESVSKIN